MRGKPASGRGIVEWDGITPADAGKTKTLTFTFEGREDHPRGCGENHSATKPSLRANGSPPRMRGKRHRKGGRKKHMGITPADAGKTEAMNDGLF